MVEEAFHTLSVIIGQLAEVRNPALKAKVEE